MSQDLTQIPHPTDLSPQERSLDQTFSEVDLHRGIEASANMAMLQVTTFTRGQKKALDVIERIADEGLKSVDRQVDALLLQRYENELREILTKTETLLAKDPQDVDLTDFVTAKRDLRRARRNVAEQLKIVDPEMDANDIDGFFADVDTIINMKRPSALRATRVEIDDVWSKPASGDGCRKAASRQTRRKIKTTAK